LSKKEGQREHPFGKTKLRNGKKYGEKMTKGKGPTKNRKKKQKMKPAEL